MEYSAEDIKLKKLVQSKLESASQPTPIEHHRTPVDGKNPPPEQAPDTNVRDSKISNEEIKNAKDPSLGAPNVGIGVNIRWGDIEQPSVNGNQVQPAGAGNFPAPPGNLNIMPMPDMARNQPVRPLAVPGAFAHYLDQPPADDGTVAYTVGAGGHPNHQQGANANNEGLAVANLVDEQHPRDLQQAQGVNPEAANTREERTKQFKRNVLLAVLVMLALALVIVTLLVPSRNDDEDVEATPVPSPAPSESPTPAPTTLEDYVISLLPEDTIALLEEPNSPQSISLQWMMEDPDLVLLTDDRMIQRFALATLFYSTNGDDWSYNVNWLSYEVHECEWFMMPHFAMKNVLEPLYPGYFTGFELPPDRCDENGLYQNLWLDVNNLAGQLPEEFYLLKSLKTFSFAYNHQLQGTISAKVGNLEALEAIVFIGLQRPEFESTIPTELGLLTNLRALNLYENFHSGNLPTEIWSLTKLEHLAVGVNPELVGSISSNIGNLRGLKYFSFIGNPSMGGKLPTEIGLATLLEFLVMLENQNTGTVPTELGLLSNVHSFSLFGNKFTGTIPTELGGLSSVTWLDLADNLISGTIPSELGRLTAISRGLELHKCNSLTGTIPTEIGLLSDMHIFRAYRNSHTGPIPSELGVLTSLGRLELNNNTFTGTIPEELTGLQSMYFFRLEDNAFLTGTVPSGICKSNGICVGNGIFDCEESSDGVLRFDCSSHLCGCDCPCQED